MSSTQYPARTVKRKLTTPFPDVTSKRLPMWPDVVKLVADARVFLYHATALVQVIVSRMLLHMLHECVKGRID